MRGIKKMVKRGILNQRLAQEDLNFNQLSFETTQKNVIKNEEALKLLLDGKVLIVRKYVQNRKLEKMIYDSCGVKFHKIEDLHNEITPNKLTDLILKNRGSTNTILLQNKIIIDFAKSIGLNDFYIELEPNIRMQPPFKYIQKFTKEIESKVGTGQLTPHTVHKDSWFHHPKNTFNIWVALTSVDQFSGLTILENSQDYYPRTKNQELLNFKDSKSIEHKVLDLEKGDAVIFLAELLHGSIINQKSETRGTISMRFSPNKPDNQESIKYWYDYYDSKNQKLKKVNNVSLDRFNPVELERDYNNISIDNNFKRYSKNTISVDVDGEEINYPRYCPHQGVDLLCGHYDKNIKKIICPSHRLCVSPKRKI